MELVRKVDLCRGILDGKYPRIGNWWVKSRTFPYTYIGARMLECVDLAAELGDLLRAEGLSAPPLPSDPKS